MRYKYTSDDIEFLKTYYPIRDWDKIHNRFIGVSESSIHHKCSRLGIKADNSYKRSFDNTSTRKKWNKDEINILLKNYPNVPMEEMLNLLPYRTKDSIVAKALQLKISSYATQNKIWKESEIQYIKDNWNIIPDKLIAKTLNRSFRSVKWKREELGLFRQSLDRKSYPTLTKYLRGNNQQWKLDSMKNSDYKCVLTGSKDFEIHHLYGVSNIISDLLDKYPFYKDKSFSDYTESELSFILEKFIDEQAKHPYGECVDKKIHTLFHSMYGQYYNTPEQWNQFKIDYLNGKYDKCA